MKTIDILKENTLSELLCKYEAGDKDEILSQLNKWIEILSADNIIIPVLGVQGAGKSSLLNALLMDDIILPVDSDETTCIPTEIIYANENKQDAEIIFEDGHTELVACSEAGLKPFVHQEENEDNKKGVNSIRVFRHSSLLENGVILVDLPGVGSLTESNIKITMSYLEKSISAIFLLRTIPPITRSESAFIKTAWPILGKVFFVQNQWNDESTIEANDGKEHSLIVLNDIAKASKLNSSDIDIDIVNVYKALTSKITDDNTSLEKSGIYEFKKKIEIFVHESKIAIATNIKDRLVLEMINIKSLINNEFESLNTSSIELEKKYAQEREQFEDKYNAAKKKYKKTKRTIKDREYELDGKIKKQVQINEENFRNEIRTILNKGIATDGSKLENAFSDLRKEQTENIYEKIVPLFEQYIEDTIKELENIPNLNQFENSYNVGIDENIHFESLLSKGFGAAGGIGGAIGAAALGAKAGAAMGVVLGPVGIIVVGALGALVGGMLASKAGSLTEQTIIRKRAAEARKVIFPIIDIWAKDIHTNFRAQLSQLTEQITSSVDDYFEESKKTFEAEMQKLENNSKLSDMEKKNELKKLENDQKNLVYLFELLKKAE